MTIDRRCHEPAELSQLGLFEQQEAIAGVARANERQQNRERFITLPPYPEEEQSDNEYRTETIRSQGDRFDVKFLADDGPFVAKPLVEDGHDLREIKSRSGPFSE
jgi:hypothetical protein